MGDDGAALVSGTAEPVDAAMQPLPSFPPVPPVRPSTGSETARLEPAPTPSREIDIQPEQSKPTLDTSGLSGWLLDNIVPLMLFVVAVLLLWLGGGKGDNAGVMRRLGGLIVALAVVGMAVTGAGESIGTWIVTLFTG